MASSVSAELLRSLLGLRCSHVMTVFFSLLFFCYFETSLVEWQILALSGEGMFFELVLL